MVKYLKFTMLSRMLSLKAEMLSLKAEMLSSGTFKGLEFATFKPQDGGL